MIAVIKHCKHLHLLRYTHIEFETCPRTIFREELLYSLSSQLFHSVALFAIPLISVNICRFHTPAGSGTVTLHVFGTIYSSPWIKLVISNGAVVKKDNDIDQDQWSFCLL